MIYGQIENTCSSKYFSYYIYFLNVPGWYSFALWDMAVGYQQHVLSSHWTSCLDVKSVFEVLVQQTTPVSELSTLWNVNMHTVDWLSHKLMINEMHIHHLAELQGICACA